MDEMLDVIKPDGAIIALPNALHVEAALACIERGIPSLVEKPLADTLEAALHLTEAAERSGVPVLVGHQRSGVGPGEGDGEVEDPDAAQRPRSFLAHAPSIAVKESWAATAALRRCSSTRIFGGFTILVMPHM